MTPKLQPMPVTRYCGFGRLAHHLKENSLLGKSSVRKTKRRCKSLALIVPSVHLLCPSPCCGRTDGATSDGQVHSLPPRRRARGEGRLVQFSAGRTDFVNKTGSHKQVRRASALWWVPSS